MKKDMYEVLGDRILPEDHRRCANNFNVAVVTGRPVGNHCRDWQPDIQFNLLATLPHFAGQCNASRTSSILQRLFLYRNVTSHYGSGE
ncbi:hypothetical protein ABKN59_006794 [Abortiporus biennis]